jgi:dihydrofolate reductase
MSELIVDFIISLDGYASAEGWPGWWGLQGPEYLAWLGERPDRDNTLLMGANTYRVMYGFAGQSELLGSDEADSVSELTRLPKVVFSSTLKDPLPWANTRLVNGDAIEAVRAMKAEGTNLSTIGSLTLCRSLIMAGVVDRFRVVVFPVITGKTGSERIYDGYPDVALDMIASRTFDGRIQLLEYVPRVLTEPPGTQAAPDGT